MPSPVRDGCARWHVQGRSEKRLPEPSPTLCLLKLFGNAVADTVTRANKPSHRISPDVVSGNGEHKQTVVPSPHSQRGGDEDMPEDAPAGVLFLIPGTALSWEETPDSC